MVHWFLTQYPVYFRRVSGQFGKWEDITGLQTALSLIQITLQTFGKSDPLHATINLHGDDSIYFVQVV